jgi:hypothetical protein
MISSGFRNFARNAGSGLNVSAGSRDNVASSDAIVSLWTKCAVPFMAIHLLLLSTWSLDCELEAVTAITLDHDAFHTKFREPIGTEENPQGLLGPGPLPARAAFLAEFPLLELFFDPTKTITPHFTVRSWDIRRITPCRLNNFNKSGVGFGTAGRYFAVFGPSGEWQSQVVDFRQDCRLGAILEVVPLLQKMGSRTVLVCIFW